MKSNCRKIFIAVCFLFSLLYIEEGRAESMDISSGSAAELAPLKADSSVWLREVSIVALKQEDHLRDEALASTLLGGPQLDAANAVSVKNISEMVPNFYVPDYGSRITSTMYVRGIGARMDQPAVGLNVDNVPILNKNAFDFDVADIVSVEMLRGPQSTLYGRNTIGGLINITTLSPFAWQGWRFRASAASHNDYRLSAGRYAKFGDHLAASLSLNAGYLGGFFRNQYNGEKIDKERMGALRFKLDWRPSKRFSLLNTFSASLLRQGGYPYEYLPTSRIEYNDTCFYRRTTLQDGLTIRYEGSKFQFASVTSFQYISDNMTLDQDFLPQSYFIMSQRQHDYSFTEDFLVKPLNVNTHNDWRLGAFLFYKHQSMWAPVTFKEVGIERLIVANRNNANPDYPIKWSEQSFPLLSDFRIPTFGGALYYQTVVTEGRWKFTAGLRLDWEKSVLRYHSECHTGYQIDKKMPDGSLSPYRDVNIDIDDRGRLSRNYFNWMPRISALYSFSETGDNNIYANVSKGYKAGGFNTQMFSDVLQQRLMGVMGIGAAYDVDEIVGYKPEYSWNYELGLHLTFPSQRLAGDISLFYIHCRDQQLTMFPDGTTTGRIMTNAGATRSMGAEVSLSWRPLRDWSVALAYGMTDAKFLKFNNGKEDFKGKRVPYVPANTLYLSSDYRFELAADRFMKAITIGVDLRGTGPIYWNESNSRRERFYLLPGAYAELEGEKWSLQIWGKNLSNTRYSTFYFLSMGNEFLQRGRPLQIGATLSFNI